MWFKRGGLESVPVCVRVVQYGGWIAVFVIREGSGLESVWFKRGVGWSLCGSREGWVGVCVVQEGVGCSLCGSIGG